MNDETKTMDAVVELEQKAVAQPAVQVASPADPYRVLQTAVERGMSADVIDKIMGMVERAEQMRERERQRQAEQAFRAAFADFRGENVIVPKTKHVNRGNGGSFDQAEFDVVCRLLSPALSRHGFGFRHDMRFGSRKWSTEGVESDIPWVYVTCYLEHREGFSEKLELEGPPGEMSANTPVQNMQVTGSYLKRQSLLAITGTATSGDDDEARLERKAGAEVKQGAFDELLEAGRTAAIDGSKSLTAWWSTLDNKQRTLMNKEFGRLRKDAAANDKPVDHQQEARHER